MTDKIKLGIVGARRGLHITGAFAGLNGKIELTAICDLNEQLLRESGNKNPGVGLYTDYDKMLAESDCNAVFVSTPYPIHAGQAVKAMESGRHVLSEVVAAHTIDDCWKLVEAVEKTGLTYMFAENYCYMRHNMMVLNMVQKGLFGELTYAEGAYIHDCREIFFNSDGTPTWRGLIRHETNGNTYPTHSLGPVAQWLGINRTDRLTTASSFATQQTSTTRYVQKKFGPDNPASKPEWYMHGDSATTVINTGNGAVIVIRVDWSSIRPHNMTHYVLQGSKGAYISPRHEKENPLVWIEGRSEAREDGIALGWDELEKYSSDVEHPLWKEYLAQAEKAGHGGGDFFIFHDFAEAVLEEKTPPIDVYDAVTWSCIVPLSLESIEKGGAPVPVPDFRSGRKAAASS